MHSPESWRDTITCRAIVDGFAPFDLEDVVVVAGKTTSANIALKMPVETQQVEVTEQGIGVDTSADSNASAMVIKGKDLDALSDDPDELQSELSALAGPSAGPNGGQIYIDGFTADSFRQNPPSARFASTRTRFQRSTTSWDTGALRFLPSPAPTSFTACS
jgi:hypothetical protein